VDDLWDDCRRATVLYLARIEDLGRGDLVQINCAACHHIALLTPDFLLRQGLSPRPRCSIYKGRVRCRGCGAGGTGGEVEFKGISDGVRAEGIVYLRACSSTAGAKAMIETRISKVIMVASLALFALLVTFDNLTDYDTNYAFVWHVLSMDTTFPGNALLYRRITSPALWQVGYALIIAGEGLSGIVLAVAAISLAWRLRSDSVRFNHAKRFLIIGAALGFLVWFFGFMVIGGEWFSMWQSPTWNGQEAAFRFYMTILAVLIFVTQPDGELSASGRQPAMRQRE